MAVKQYRKIRLLPKKYLVKTSEVDHADWNFRPVLGYIQRIRFRLIARMLGGTQVQRLLEIGYGSGVFMPELSRYCDHLYGIDPHPMSDRVSGLLTEYGVNATLLCHRAESLPFDDEFFDCIVAVSAMEYVTDVGEACSEIARVLTQNGVFLMVTPGHSPVGRCGVEDSHWKGGFRGVFESTPGPDQWVDATLFI